MWLVKEKENLHFDLHFDLLELLQLNLITEWDNSRFNPMARFICGVGSGHNWVTYLRYTVVQHCMKRPTVSLGLVLGTTWNQWLQQAWKCVDLICHAWLSLELWNLLDLELPFIRLWEWLQPMWIWFVCTFYTILVYTVHYILSCACLSVVKMKSLTPIFSGLQTECIARISPQDGRVTGWLLMHGLK